MGPRYKMVICVDYRLLVCSPAILQLRTSHTLIHTEQNQNYWWNPAAALEERGRNLSKDPTKINFKDFYTIHPVARTFRHSPGTKEFVL
jgi:hypothetical protein